MDWLVDQISPSFSGDRYPVNIGATAAQVAGAFCFWLLLYAALCRTMRDQRCEWHCRMVTAIHATVVSALAFVDVFVLGRIPFLHKNQVQPYTELEKFLFTVCLGYFLFDLAWCLYYGTEGAFMIFHHAAGVAGLAVTLCSGKCGAEMAAAIGGTEVTNPLLQLRWFLREQGHGESRLVLCVELLFFASFGCLRLLAGGALAASYLANPRCEPLGRLAAVIIYGIGCVFFVQLCSYGARRRSKMLLQHEQQQQQQEEEEEEEEEEQLDKATTVTRPRG